VEYFHSTEIAFDFTRQAFHGPGQGEREKGFAFGVIPCFVKQDLLNASHRSMPYIWQGLCLITLGGDLKKSDSWKKKEGKKKGTRSMPVRK
jgi:hypothetical protein